MEQGCEEDQSQVLGELQNPLNKITSGERVFEGALRQLPSWLSW